jgi:hypothetical protein
MLEDRLAECEVADDGKSRSYRCGIVLSLDLSEGRLEWAL